MQNAIAELLEDMSKNHPDLFQEIMKECGLVPSQTESEVN